MPSFTFDFATEVWSFGIISWEIYSGGQEPYSGLMVCDVNEQFAIFELSSAKPLFRCYMAIACQRQRRSQSRLWWSNTSGHRPINTSMKSRCASRSTTTRRQRALLTPPKSNPRATSIANKAIRIERSTSRAISTTAASLIKGNTRIAVDAHIFLYQ